MAVALVGGLSLAIDNQHDTFAVDAGSADNRLLVVVATSAESNDTLENISYGGQSLTRVVQFNEDDIQNPENAELWYLVAPASGSNPLSFSWSGTADYAITAAVFSGIDQNNPLGDSATASEDAVGANTPSVVSVEVVRTGDLVVFGGGDDIDSASVRTAQNGTEMTDRVAGDGAGDFGAFAGYLVAAAGETEVGWQISSGPADFRMVAAVFRAHRDIHIDYAKAHFISIYPPDKVLFISDRLSATAPAAEPAVSAGFSDSFSHDGGPDVAVTGVFSVDGTNYHPFGAYIEGDIEVGGSPEFLTLDGYMSAPGEIEIKGVTGFFAEKTVYMFLYLESLS